VLILCQGDFKEQICKLAVLLLYTSEDCWRKDQAWITFCTHWVIQRLTFLVNKCLVRTAQ